MMGSSIEVFICHICYRKFYDKERYLDHTYGLEDVKPKQKEEKTDLSYVWAAVKGILIGSGIALYVGYLWSALR